MFDRIADRYDLMNSVMTAGMHHRWRARAADLARVRPGRQRTRRVLRDRRPGARAVRGGSGRADAWSGLDFSEPMLELAREKSRDAGVHVAWMQGNALELPFGDGEFDAATVGFGVRNLVDLERGIAEMARVVRPGGRVVILEITTPRRPPLSWFYAVWFDRIVPLLGTLAGDRDAYTYLPSSVRRFPPADGAGGADARRRPARDPLPHPGRRDHRDPFRDTGGDSPSGPWSGRVSSVDEVMLLGGERMPALMERVERLLDGDERRPRARARARAQPTRCRRAASGCGRCSS